MTHKQRVLEKFPKAYCAMLMSTGKYVIKNGDETIGKGINQNKAWQSVVTGINPRKDLLVTAKTLDGKKVTGYYRYYPTDRCHLLTKLDGFSVEVDPATVKLKNTKQ